MEDLKSSSRRAFVNRSLTLGTGAALAPLLSEANNQAAYPNKPIRLVVPTPAGGPADLTARIVAEKLQATLGQPIVIENKPGANQIIGTDLVAKSAPDGYTLLLVVDSTMTMHQSAYKRLPYDPANDFAHIATLANTLVLLIARQGILANTLPEFLAMATKQRSKFSLGTGTLTTQVIAERLNSMVKLDILSVPYKGSGQVVNALLSGEIDLAVDGFTAYKAHLAKRDLKLLAITGDHRASILPDVPTFAESGYPGFSAGVWVGLAAPSGTPDSVISRLATEVEVAMSTADVGQRLTQMGLEPMFKNPSNTRAFIKDEASKWSTVIREAGIALD